ncbi:hypothetical protein [Paenibacillus lentus]|uniref:Uncharacterized protein n=1 Tax=Paenibacillus lentus TaxID=1338368 RepID=A0A3S8RQX0_9BACL|nr:hypothetical protein [Paenibacillus lentus]AZK45341.1 hypothetical protein EIM92_03245 [Paenibacillus lentus]
MKDIVFEYYQNEVRTYALVHKHIKKHYYFVNTMMILCSVIILTCVFISLFNVGYRKWLIISSIVSMIILSYSVFIFFRAVKRVIRKRYKISVGRRIWKSAKLKELKSNKLTDFLYSKDIKTRWKIEKLIELYKNDKEKSKLPPLIAPSLLVAVLTPNLTQLLFYVYKDKELMQLFDILMLFAGCTFLSLILIAIFTSLIRLKDSIVNDIFQNQNSIREGLIQQLEDLLLRMPDEVEKGQAKDVIKQKEDTEYKVLRRKEIN